MSKDLRKEIQDLNKRISELEDMIAQLLQPLQNVSKTTQNYLRIAGLALDHGGLTPDILVPEIKDPISKEIIRVLLDRNDQNISQITELVRNKRGTASRRIIRQRLTELLGKNILTSKQKGSLTVYNLSPGVIKKWSEMLGLTT